MKGLHYIFLFPYDYRYGSRPTYLIYLIIYATTYQWHFLFMANTPQFYTVQVQFPSYSAEHPMLQLNTEQPRSVLARRHTSSLALLLLLSSPQR